MSKYNVIRRDGARDESKTNNYGITILKQIGHGTFGNVYLGKTKDGRQVAVKKVLQDSHYKNRECQIMQMINHQYIVKLLGYYFNNERKNVYLHLIMENIPCCLYDYIYKLKVNHQLMNPTLVKVYFFQMIRALNYLHSQNICHRDIKPQNILIDQTNYVAYLCDFGSAKILEEGQPNISYISSRYYRAPELMFKAVNYTCSIDVWGIACVWYEMLRGSTLFPGNSPDDQLVQIMRIIGTPTVADVSDMNPKMVDEVNRLPMYRPRQLSVLFTQPVPSDTIDLLSKLLIFSPVRRLTAFQAMLHPYFDELREPGFSLPEGRSISDLFVYRKCEISDPSKYDILVPPHMRGPHNWPYEALQK